MKQFMFTNLKEETTQQQKQIETDIHKSVRKGLNNIIRKLNQIPINHRRFDICQKRTS